MARRWGAPWSVVVLMALSIALPVWGSTAQDWQAFLRHPPTPNAPIPYRSCFERAAKAQGLPMILLAAVARGESGFDPRAHSPADAYGLMQIQWPGTAQHLGIQRRARLLDPCTNVSAGAAYLVELRQRYGGDLHRALAAYNYGPGRIGLAPQAIPVGAEGYSAYIYRHLRRLTRGGAQAGRWPAIRFRRAWRAAALARHLATRAPDVAVEWWRSGKQEYWVGFTYQDAGQQRSGRKKLRELGI